MWKGPKEIFTYTKKQRNGLLILILLVLIIQGIIYFNKLIPAKGDETENSRLVEIIASWQKAEDSVGQLNVVAVELFPFDPNSATIDDLEKLGLQPFLAKRIEKYRRGGGQFYQKEDLLNIYGMDSTWYFQVQDFVSLSGEPKEVANFKKEKLRLQHFELNQVSQTELESYNIKEWQARRIINYREKVHPYKSKEELFKVYGLDSAFVRELLPFVILEESAEVKDESVKVVELNSADSLTLISIRGIGPTYAKRIIAYREKLGGFYKKEQLLEVYGIREEQYENLQRYFKVDQTLIHRINLNRATFKELVHHPYLSYEQVKSIVNFRENVRPFESVEELKQLELIDDALFSKIANYLNPSFSSELKD